MRRNFLLGMAATLVAGAALPGVADAATGPVNAILVQKKKRLMYLCHGNTVIRKYAVDLGFNPLGHKRQKGDGRTPEGRYSITHRNPSSAFHLSLGISYPNRSDRAQAHEMGLNPGGDIFIHGRGARMANAGRDWTAGCIAVKDEEMDEIFRLVTPGTPIWIKP